MLAALTRMENRAHALAAGIFAIILALAGAFTVWWLSGKREPSREYLLVTRQNVTGLNLQAQVRYRGIRAGKVVDIDIDHRDPRFINVLITLDADMPVTKGTTARLNFQGLTGLAYVQLEDSGENTEPLRGQGGQPPRIVLRGSPFDDIGGALRDVIGDVKTAVSRINRVLSDDNLQRIDATLASARQAADGANAAVKDLPRITAALRQALSPANIDKLEQTLANLEKTTHEATPLVSEVRGLVATLQGVSRRLESVAGGAGGELANTTLPRVNGLLEELTRTSRQLSRVLSEIEESPNMLIFGKGRQRPGPGETGYGGE